MCHAPRCWDLVDILPLQDTVPALSPEEPVSLSGLGLCVLSLAITTVLDSRRFVFIHLWVTEWAWNAAVLPSCFEPCTWLWFCFFEGRVVFDFLVVSVMKIFRHLHEYKEEYNEQVIIPPSQTESVDLPCHISLVPAYFHPLRSFLWIVYICLLSPRVVFRWSIVFYAVIWVTCCDLGLYADSFLVKWSLACLTLYNVQIKIYIFTCAMCIIHMDCMNGLRKNYGNWRVGFSDPLSCVLYSGLFVTFYLTDFSFNEFLLACWFCLQT